MGQIDKGVVAMLVGTSTARVAPYGPQTVSYDVTIPERLRGYLAKGDAVVYAIFDDQTGNIICRADGADGQPSVTGPWVEYTTNDAGNVTAAKLHGFTKIPDRMFYNLTTLASVDLSDCPELTEIGQYAFYSCTALALSALPDTVTVIGSNAFRYCAALAITKLPASLTNIGGDAFGGCTGLTTLEIAAANLGIGTKIFEQCTGLTKVWLRSTVASIFAVTAANCPFKGCSDSLQIYAEPASAPSGWDSYFNRTGTNGAVTVTVTYNQTTCPW